MATKCYSCNVFYAVRDNLCSSCYQKLVEEPKYMSQPFGPNIYDSIITMDCRKLYFNKHAGSFWEYFKQMTGIKHTLIVNSAEVFTIFMSLVNSGHIGKMLLLTNGFCGGKPFMTKASILMAVAKDLNLNMTTYGNVLAQLAIDPWNFKDGNILKTYGNKGLQPALTADIMKLYVNNKITSHLVTDKIFVTKCQCGHNIYSDDIDISKAPNFVSRVHKCKKPYVWDPLADDPMDESYP